VRNSIPVVRAIHKDGLCYAADFACAAYCYWFAVFPRVAREVGRRRALALRIPDPTLRRLALEALDRKRGNLEGAAVFASLVPRKSRSPVVRALVSAQVTCDYLDLLSEQPNQDPVANGYRLHDALIVATSPGRAHSDYYQHHERGDDGGYLRALVESIREGISSLPLLSLIAEPMRRAVERIAAYQAFNHGDIAGSYVPFERWACSETSPATGLSWWETGAGAGSTLTLLVLIAAAADPNTSPSDVPAIESAYFPWIGALHSLLDSLVDHDEDLATGERGLIDCYFSPAETATRMRVIAREALRRAVALPSGRHHALILAAMSSFYICEIRGSTSPHAQLAAPGVLDAFGCLATPTMAVLGARRSLRRVRAIGADRAPPKSLSPAPEFLESQVPDFPLFMDAAQEHDVSGHEPMPIRSRAPQGAGRPAHRR
jgi:tetraprenyl-beta-curcumene synthase